MTYWPRAPSPKTTLASTASRTKNIPSRPIIMIFSQDTAVTPKHLRITQSMKHSRHLRTVLVVAVFGHASHVCQSEGHCCTESGPWRSCLLSIARQELRKKHMRRSPPPIKTPATREAINQRVTWVVEVDKTHRGDRAIKLKHFVIFFHGFGENIHILFLDKTIITHRRCRAGQ